MALVKLTIRLAAAALIAGWPASAHAQTVRGRVLGADGTAARGATVLLLDSAGATRGGAFVDAEGAFCITTSSPGRYVLEVQRIGLLSTRSQWFDLAAGQSVQISLTVPVEAIALPEIEAVGENRCGDDTDPQVATVWEEARKALRAATLTAQSSLYRFEIRHHYRRLSVPSLRITRDSAVFQHRRHTGSPFTSLPADTLILRGFIQEKADGVFYNAPDADVLLSPTFADAFCFDLTANRARNLIGLTFEPVQDRVRSSIKGTLWIDRGSSELRFIEYEYVGSEVRPGAQGLIGGRIDFRRLPDGPWIVDRWYIRMPLYAERRQVMMGGGVGRQIVLTGLTEEGAEVLSVSNRNGAPASTRPAESGSLPERVTPAGGVTSALPQAPVYELKPIEVVGTSAKTAVRRARGTRVDLLTRDDIAGLEARAFHVGDLVKQFPSLRVRELRHRGGAMKGLCIESMRSQMEMRAAACNSVMVVVDGTPYNPEGAGGDQVLEMLLDLSPNMLESVEYLSAAEAGPRYGTGSKHGALVIYTRGNGPYAKTR